MPMKPPSNTNRSHFDDRLMSRLSPTERHAVQEAVATVRPHVRPHEDVAVYAHRLPEPRKAPCGSMGEHVVVVFRAGKPATVMLRGDLQPATAAALRVHRVLGREVGA